MGLWKDRPVLHSPLYYVNFFQYRSGDLYRAILGREVIWDREFEEECMIRLDDVLRMETHECKILKYVGVRIMPLRGIFWRWNSWNLGRQHCSIMLDSNKPFLIWMRRNGEQTDIEGPISMGNFQTRDGVITISTTTWKKRYEHLFKEVTVDHGNERSVYKNPDSPWRVIDCFPDGVSLLPEKNGKRSDQEESESVREVPETTRKRVVPHPWRLSKNF